MHLLRRFLWPDDVRARFALAAVLAVVVPALLLGPWLPLLDLIGFVGMNSYAPKLSSGPIHFSVFQFTYIIHYALSRLLVDLGMSAGMQVVTIYLLQALILFWVIQALLRRFITHPWLCSLAIAVGTLAFWDGHFLWGGPLAFSLAAVVLAAATALTFRETEQPVGTVRLAVPLLTVFSMMCHPFAFPFAMILAGLRFLFIPRCRQHSTLLALGLILFAWVIRNDSPESPETLQLSTLFGFSIAQLGKRLAGLFVTDGEMTSYLFGGTPWALRCYMVVMGAVHLAGFVTAPVVLWREKGLTALRLLAALTVSIAGLYFISAENLIVTQWPQRILTFYSPFTFVAGIVLPWHVIQLRRNRPDIGSFRVAAPLWAIPAVTLFLIVWIQVPIFRLGKSIGDNLANLRDGIVKTGLTNSFLVFSNLDGIHPFYLRSVPFLLFSDPEMVKRGLIFFTEWHLQPRHPTRLIEQWIDLGRTKVEARLSVLNRALSLNLTLRPQGEALVPTGINEDSYGSRHFMSLRQEQLAIQLLQVGAIRDAVPHFEAALRLTPDRPHLANNLGVALRRLGKPGDAIPHLRNAIQLNPNYAEAFANLGGALGEIGQFDESVRSFGAAMKLRPDVAEWYYELGTILKKGGRNADAASCFEKSLALKPDNQQAATELARLRKGAKE